MVPQRLDECTWAIFELTPPWSNIICLGPHFMWIGPIIWLHKDQTSDSEQCSNQYQLRPNFDLGQLFMCIGATNNHIEARWLFRLTPTRHNYNVGQLFVYIGANNDQMWLSWGQSNDFDQCSNLLQFHIVSHLGNIVCEWVQIMTIHDFLEASRVILSNVWIDSILT